MGLFNRKIVSVLEKGMHWIPDSVYLRLKFRKRMGYSLHLKSPKSFNEKLQWLKLNDHRPIYTTLVDKYAVKDYITRRLGEEYVIPTLGVWDRFDEIDFDNLPDQFVLKCTHDSGGLVVCRDKSKLDLATTRRKIEGSLRNNYYWHGREWAYKNVPPRIIAEKYMEDANSTELRDYKFYCFDGEPRFLYLSEGLENHATARISYVTMDWEMAPFTRPDYRPFDTLPPKPKKFDDMVQVARNLSKDVPFARIDLYEINGKVYFGEFTLSPGIGMNRFVPEQYDYELGDWLHLPNQE